MDDVGIYFVWFERWLLISSADITLAMAQSLAIVGSTNETDGYVGLACVFMLWYFCLVTVIIT